MNAPVRLGGRAPLADGGWLTWSVADGHRGRRWRMAIEGGGRLILSGLLELDPGGRFAKLELAAPNGLLTLHPERSAELHGNAVLAEGVRHLALAWSPDHALEIEGLPITAAITAARLATIVAVGEGSVLPCVTVALDLRVTEGRRHYLRLTERTWRIEGGAEAKELTLDERGLPDWGSGAVEWALELHPHD